MGGRGVWPERAVGRPVVVVAIGCEPLAGLVAELLAQGGYEVRVRPDLDAAWDVHDVDAVVVDLGARRTSPRSLRGGRPVPALALTSRPREPAARRLPGAEPVEWLGKPFSPVDLLVRVAALLHRAAERRTRGGAAGR